ncbi:MAG: radical SAM protein, partial [Lawsonibacter sp.]|nr:radical SAM protein [Lawsonibacter sp.]
MSMTAVKSVDPRSPARRAGVRVGETLTHINGHPIVDVLDYKFYSYDPRLELTLKSPEGTVRTLRVRKSEGEDLGLEFETYLMDRARSCANHCIFCFVDQMPPGMRPSLYFKDDDARLSFLLGNYLTLTNLSPREVQRIIDLRISPINVSVHTTDRALRAEMLKNRRAGEGIDIMERFAAHNITMNCQIVSCPGVNDGPALDKTLNDLAAMFPAVNSVSAEMNNKDYFSTRRSIRRYDASRNVDRQMLMDLL